VFGSLSALCCMLAMELLAPDDEGISMAYRSL
jgi:hypothetical protein